MRILVECYPDEALLRALGVPRKQLRHESCKGQVVKRVLKFDCATGVIDEDPTSAQPREMDKYRQVQTAEGIRLLARRGDEDKRLIVICPRLEEWLIQRARSSGVEPEDYGLPRDPDRLHSMPRYEKKPGFDRFLTALSEQDKAMDLLREWLFYRER